MNLQSARPPDLLRERREALGITELPPQITSTEQLLLRGALVGGGLLALVMPWPLSCFCARRPFEASWIG